MCNTFLVKIFCSIAQKNSLKEYFHKRRPGVLLLLLKKTKKQNHDVVLKNQSHLGLIGFIIMKLISRETCNADISPNESSPCHSESLFSLLSFTILWLKPWTLVIIYQYDKNKEGITNLFQIGRSFSYVAFTFCKILVESFIEFNFSFINKTTFPVVGNSNVIPRISNSSSPIFF